MEKPHNVDKKFRPGNYHDIESGYPGKLYPAMVESPEFRWAFIRKVYCIISVQFLLTVGVAATVVYVREIPEFIVKTKPGLAIYILIIITTFILLIPLHFCGSKHPWNFVFLFLFTIAIAFAVGLSCAFRKGEIVLEAAILTCTVVIGLTLYTFWAVNRGQDFNFLGPFLFACLLMLLVFTLIQIFLPFGKVTQTIYGVLAALIFSGYIVYDTDNLIKRFTYDEYILAAVSLYLDIINLFLSILTAIAASDN